MHNNDDYNTYVIVIKFYISTFSEKNSKLFFYSFRILKTV